MTTAFADLADDDIVTLREAAPVLKKSVSTLYKWRDKNYGPASFKNGATVVMRVGAIRNYLKQQEKSPVLEHRAKTVDKESKIV